MSPTREGISGLSFPRQVWNLFRIQLTNWRWSWPQMVLTGMLAPMVSLAALGLFARESGPEASEFVLTGSVTMAILFETQNKIASNFAFMRSTGAFEYYASMPVRREALILATLGAFSLLSLPAVAVTLLLGSALLDVPLGFSPFAPFCLLLALLPSAGLGALIGSRCTTIEQASSLSLATTLLMMTLGPVAVPPDLLPDILVTIGHANPAVYASSTLRQSITSPSGLDVLPSLGALCVFALAAWLLTTLGMHWRARYSRVS
ncbi:ABC transporter permease [Streptomyces clavuligerus]|uniref:Transport permease protein n=2 Tax=Streptomyces clavuligerus TaxID=1901 RepID=E2Q6Q3_STRCL|nr:ABC transporter permease [Streptomyces clavuligerus]ANW18067.1 ABC transporter [Streptomyces clavuligerus]AXU12626.1 ABC transporter permease [Streptomyces clavuligerus]EFG09352.1 ABC-2 type transporter [Streptomyces clavuligerus]MBY6302528.1 ABC transporter permease [Streptomyces clavuligerus]QCS05407.1 ABC transporter permease [Streptomyces clavuligerus]